MANLSEADKWMFLKWSQDKYCWMRDEFWDDVLLKYKERRVEIPMDYNPHAIRRLMTMLKCDKCAECCTSYDQVPIDQTDLTLIANNSKYDLHYMASIFRNDIQSNMYIQGKPCEFLRDKLCTIYDCRPSTCYFFPIDGANEYQLGDKTIHRTCIRLKCKPAVDVVKQIFQEGLCFEHQQGSTLLPDLTLVDVSEFGGKKSG